MCTVICRSRWSNEQVSIYTWKTWNSQGTTPETVETKVSGFSLTPLARKFAPKARQLGLTRQMSFANLRFSLEASLDTFGRCWPTIFRFMFHRSCSNIVSIMTHTFLNHVPLVLFISSEHWPTCLHSMKNLRDCEIGCIFRSLFLVCSSISACSFQRRST